MKKNIIALIMCMMILSGCGSDYTTASKNITKELGSNFTVVNTYKDNTLKKAVAKDDSNNYYLFTIDGKDRLIFSDIYEKYQADKILKEKIEEYLQDDYLLYVQYNINDSNTCDIYLFTDYQLNIQFIAQTLVNEIDELSEANIIFHTATVDSHTNLRKFKIIINKELDNTGMFTDEMEAKIATEVSDYQITTIKK